MMLGLGSDLCDSRRVEALLAQHGARFLERVFTVGERAVGEARGVGRAAFYAKRFAAKEAGAKALGTGFRDGVFLTDFEVQSLPGGQPVLVLHGAALARLAEVVPAGHAPRVFLSLSDEPPYAFAQVIISAEPLAAA